AADLVKGKLGARPVAVVRGIGHLLLDDGDDRDGDDNGNDDHGRDDHEGDVPRRARDLVRDGSADLLRLGTAEALAQGRRVAVPARRSVRRFSDESVDADLLAGAVADALTAPAPHHSTPVRFVRVAGHARMRLLDALRADWERDLRADGHSGEIRGRRRGRGDLLRTCPELILPFVDDSAGAHDYPDARRAACEETMFTVAGGA